MNTYDGRVHQNCSVTARSFRKEETKDGEVDAEGPRGAGAAGAAGAALLNNAGLVPVPFTHKQLDRHPEQVAQERRHRFLLGSRQLNITLSHLQGSVFH